MITKASHFIEKCREHNQPISQITLREEAADSGRTPLDIHNELHSMLEVMRQSSKAALDHGLKTIGGMIGGDAHRAWEYAGGRPLCGELIGKAMARALSCSESNASMGRICAAPTAGACGILPAALLTAGEFFEKDDDALVDALLTASGVGAVIARNATISGAEGGCQAECGAAAAMAAAAIVEMAGGSPETCFDAAAIALQNIMGLVCDPIAGLVESPCSLRNASGVVNAMLSADLALSGVHSVVPFDEVVEAMYSVGRMLPTDLRETALGGVAKTPTGKSIRDRVFGKKEAAQ